MAYNANHLSALTYANGFTLWHYKTTDAEGDVNTTGYFNGGASMLRVGDFIFVNTDTDGTPAHGLMIVLTNAGGVVDVSNAASFGTLNSD